MNRCYVTFPFPLFCRCYVTIALPVGAVGCVVPIALLVPLLVVLFGALRYGALQLPLITLLLHYPLTVLTLNVGDVVITITVVCYVTLVHLFYICLPHLILGTFVTFCLITVLRCFILFCYVTICLVLRCCCYVDCTLLGTLLLLITFVVVPVVTLLVYLVVVYDCRALFVVPVCYRTLLRYLFYVYAPRPPRLLRYPRWVATLRTLPPLLRFVYVVPLRC